MSGVSAGSSGGGGAFPKEVVDELMNLGFNQAQVFEALTVSAGDKEQAASYLMNMQNSPGLPK